MDIIAEKVEISIEIMGIISFGIKSREEFHSEDDVSRWEERSEMIGEEGLYFVCVLEEEGYRGGLLDEKRVFLKKRENESMWWT